MGKLDATAADLLYIAVSTDTGCFCYGNTTGETLAAGAELCRAGARNAALNKTLFRTSSRARIALEALLMGDFRYYHDGRVVISVVSGDLLKKAGAEEKDCQDIAALPGRVEGGVVSAVIKEIDATHCKISVRTTGLVDANAICARFGGGGHKMASGCMCVSGIYAGHIDLSETVSRDAVETVHELSRCGVERVAMVTGDGREPSRLVASELAIDEYYAECPPAEQGKKITDMVLFLRDKIYASGVDWC